MAHYFEYDEKMKSEKRDVKFSILGHSFNLVSDNGVFSKDELDDGTKTLIESAYSYGLKGTILDLGCGIGTVGIVLKKAIKDIAVTMVDINPLAVRLANENIQNLSLDQIECFESNGIDKIEKKYNFVLTNPPIRAGKKVVYSFFDGSYEVLEKNGVLLVVIRKSHGAPSAKTYLENLFGNCEILKRNKGFYILKSVK